MKNLKLNMAIEFIICFVFSLLMQIGLDIGGNYGTYISIALICGFSAASLSCQIKGAIQTKKDITDDKSEKNS